MNEVIKRLPLHPAAWLGAALLVCAMTAGAELLRQGEIIFPEILALCIGGWLAPRQPWRCAPWQIIPAIACCSALGTCISCFLPVPFFCQILLGYVLAAAVLSLLHISLIPAISAMLLPILIGTQSWIYPLSATVLAALVAAGRLFCMRRGWVQPVGTRWNYELRPMLRIWIKRLFCAALPVFAAVLLNCPFAVAPPLLVGFTELSCADSPARKMPGRILLLTFFAALLGASARLLLCNTLGAPVTLAAAVICLILLPVIARSRIFFPPAGAIALLPLLLKADALIAYPFQVLAGFALLTLLAMKCFGTGTFWETDTGSTK